MRLDQARRLKDLDKENRRLNRLVADLALPDFMDRANLSHNIGSSMKRIILQEGISRQ